MLTTTSLNAITSRPSGWNNDWKPTLGNPAVAVNHLAWD